MHKTPEGMQIVIPLNEIDYYAGMFNVTDGPIFNIFYNKYPEEGHKLSSIDISEKFNVVQLSYKKIQKHIVRLLFFELDGTFFTETTHETEELNITEIIKEVIDLNINSENSYYIFVQSLKNNITYPGLIIPKGIKYRT